MSQALSATDFDLRAHATWPKAAGFGLSFWVQMEGTCGYFFGNSTFWFMIISDLDEFWWFPLAFFLLSVFHLAFFSVETCAIRFCRVFDMDGSTGTEYPKAIEINLPGMGISSSLLACVGLQRNWTCQPTIFGWHGHEVWMLQSRLWNWEVRLQKDRYRIPDKRMVRVCFSSNLAPNKGDKPLHFLASILGRQIVHSWRFFDLSL